MAEIAEETGGFDGVALAKRLLRSVRAGSLATLDAETGAPFASLVTVATDPGGAPLILVSRLSAHTRNMDGDPRASILLAVAGRGDPLAHPRLTLSGRLELAEGETVRRRFLARHPKAELYVDFPDFTFRRLVVEAGHLNGGFAKAARLTAAQMATDLEGADPLLLDEEGALAHMNEDHADAIRLYATRLAGAPDGAWRATGLDPEGMDLAAGDPAGVDLTARLAFPERVADAGALRRMLVELAAQACARG